MRVKCVKDFGFFKSGEVYSAFRLDCSCWTVFFNDKDEMVGGARNILDEDLCDFFSCDYGRFPELKESEDECMRRALIKFTHENQYRYTKYNGRKITKEEFIMWLEKQGEQKFLDDIVKEVTKDKDAAISFLKSTGIINENGELADEYKIEQDEQKPVDYENVKPQSSAPMSYGKELEKRMNEACHRFFAPNTDNNRYSASDLFYAGVKAERDLNISAWSEEDETALDVALWCCKQAASIAKDENDMGNVWYAEHWLKSLRPQNTWKPSKEQMLAIKASINTIGKNTFTGRYLEEMLEQLKKLKEE